MEGKKMNIYKVTFFGHRDFYIDRAKEEKLFAIVRDLIQTKPYVEFFIGRNGEFDIFAASVVKRAQKAFGSENSSLTLVLPYKTKDIEYYERYYDSVMIPECVEGSHPKGAIINRNSWMVEKCDLLVCCVEREGGAYNAMKYAKKLGKEIINLQVDK